MIFEKPDNRIKIRFFFISAIIVLLSSCSRFRMASPSETLSAILDTDSSGIFFEVYKGGKSICDTSHIGLQIDGKKLYKDVKIKFESERVISDNEPTLGVHDSIKVNANEYLWRVKNKIYNISYFITVRLSDDGFAYKIEIPGKGIRHVDHELGEWNLPRNSTVCLSERNSSWKLKTYAGEWVITRAEDMFNFSSQGPIQIMPILYLTEDSTYLLVSEAALHNYSGMRLECEENLHLKANFTEKNGFDLKDTILTPWRVLLVENDLNGLVNSDFIISLNPKPDESLFNINSWIKPGRSLWSWWSGINGYYLIPDKEKEVIDFSSDLGFEYYTIDEGWECWENKYCTLKDICGYANNRNVGIFIWKNWNTINDTTENYEKMRSFMDTVLSCGVKGLKIDFINGESVGQVRFMTAALREAAIRHLLINFHGCPKPTGERRTFPNEITREAVRGLEINRITARYRDECLKKGKTFSSKYIPGEDNQYIPATHVINTLFTRCVLGPADFTPISFSIPGNLTLGFHIATAYLITSNLITVAENPFLLRDAKEYSPAIKYLMELPSAWDETIVMPQSKLNSFAAFARRKGSLWYLSAITDKECVVPFRMNFLGDGLYEASILEDDGDGGLKETILEVSKTDILTCKLVSHGGILIRFKCKK